MVRRACTRGRVALHGFVAWLRWWVVHILFLVGFRNRVLVLLNWAWSFATFTRGARLITGPHGPLPPVRTIGPDGTVVMPPPAATIGLDALDVEPRGAGARPLA